MTVDWRPWRAKLAVWLPAALLCTASIVAFIWQTSGSLGRVAELRAEIGNLEAEVARLRRLASDARAERDQVARLNREFDVLYGEVFGSLERRLTPLLRAVGTATREAGLRPSSYGYSWQEDGELQHVRFGIQFSVVGEYSQIRGLLAALQNDPQFVIVEHLGLAGEEGAATQQLQISVKLATVFAEADQELLRRLTGGIGDPQGASGG